MKTNINKMERLGMAGEDYRGLFLYQREQEDGDQYEESGAADGATGSFDAVDDGKKQKSPPAERGAAVSRQNATLAIICSAREQGKQRDRSEG